MGCVDRFNACILKYSIINVIQTLLKLFCLALTAIMSIELDAPDVAYIFTDSFGLKRYANRIKLFILNFSTPKTSYNLSLP